MYDRPYFYKRRVSRYDVPQILIASQIYRLWRPNSVIDLGCGIGSYLAGFYALGCRVRGLDVGYPVARPYMRRPIRARSRQQDLGQPMQSIKGATLVLCLDVAEHIDAANHPTMWANIRMVTRDRLLFTGGWPGQLGCGHVACRTQDQWIDAAIAAGLDWQRADTEEVREVLRTLGDPLDMAKRVLVFRRHV